MKQITHYDDDSMLNDILSKVKVLQQLELKLKKHLPENMVDHCKVANFRSGCLVIETDSAAWASDLRYRKVDLLSILRTQESVYSLSSIEVTVRPHNTPPEVQFQRPQLDKSNAATLRSMAETVENEALKEALLSLAERGQESSN